MTVNGGISHIKLSGYKSIKSADVDFNNLNVFIGANGSGKSNFMSFFQMLEFYLSSIEGLSEFVGRNGGANLLMHYGTSTTKSIEAELTFTTSSGETIYYVELGFAVGDKLYFKDEKVSFLSNERQQKPEPISLGAGNAFSRLLQISDDDADFKRDITTIRTIRNIMRKWSFFQFHNTGKEAYIRGASHLNDGGYLRSDAGNLAAILYKLQDQHPSAYYSIMSYMKQIAPFIEMLEIKEDYGSDYVRIKWSENANTNYMLDVSQMSDGTLRALALVTLLNHPDKPPLICIDEPELGLHPEAIRIIGDLIKIASEDTQIVLSTQSTKLIDCFDPEDIVVVSRDKTGTFFERLDYEKYKHWFDEYSISETWDTNIFGGCPY